MRLSHFLRNYMIFSDPQFMVTILWLLTLLTCFILFVFVPCLLNGFYQFQTDYFIQMQLLFIFVCSWNSAKKEHSSLSKILQLNRLLTYKFVHAHKHIQMKNKIHLYRSYGCCRRLPWAHKQFPLNFLNVYRCHTINFTLNGFRIGYFGFGAPILI